MHLDLDHGEIYLALLIVFPPHFELQFQRDPFQEAIMLQSPSFASCELADLELCDLTRDLCEESR